MLYDPRWTQLAEILVQYSTKTQPGDRVLISMVEIDTLPLVNAVYTQIVLAGATPYVEFHSAYHERALMNQGNLTQNELAPEIQTAAIEWADVHINIRSIRNPHEFSDIPVEKFIAHRRAMGQISALRTSCTRWVIIRIPNEAFAQHAAMSFEGAISLFFDAVLKDWTQESKDYTAIKSIFERAETVRIVGNETDICFSTKDRTYVVDAGDINMPGGEVFTAPVEDSVEGTITFDFPGVFFGQKVEGIRLELASGCVTNASAESNEELLLSLLAMDDGARRFGEFGIGTNFAIRQFCGDHFFDEKMGGTVHFALGRSYDECGGKNQSALHWDLVKDLREQGTIYLDGQIVFEQGAYLN